MKAVLITGVTSALARECLTCLDLGKYRVYGLSRQKEAQISGIEIIHADLLDQASYLPALQNIDVVLHLAALTHSRDESAYLRVNTNATIDLVDAGLRAGVKKFIYVSSRSAVARSGAYGISKLRAQEYVQATCSNYVVVRPSEVFGVGKNEGIEKLIRDAIEKRFHLYPASVPTRLSPVYAADVGRVLAQCVDSDDMRSNVLTVGGNEEFSYNEMIKAIGEWTGRPKTVLPLPRFVLTAIAAFLRTTRIKAGIVPDQVQRLYAEKDEVNLVPFPATVTLKEYVTNKA